MGEGHYITGTTTLGMFTLPLCITPLLPRSHIMPEMCASHRLRGCESDAGRHRTAGHEDPENLRHLDHQALDRDNHGKVMNVTHIFLQ